MSVITGRYTWQNYDCAYEAHSPNPQTPGAKPPLVLIHPIGVGLSRQFWQRFCQAWQAAGQENALYLPDLLGCGESEMPRIAYRPEDWAEQLQHFLTTIVQQPAIVIVQGALFPVVIRWLELQEAAKEVRGLVLAGPPALPLLTTPPVYWQQRTIWNLLDSPLGNLFFRYARRPQFLASFSIRQLFAHPDQVDHPWLEMLQAGATDLASRYAVFSFLAGFWCQDYQATLQAIGQPTFLVFGDQASSISRPGKSTTAAERLAAYCHCLPNAQGVVIPGRNVLPYEAPQAFAAAIEPFVNSLL